MVRNRTGELDPTCRLQAANVAFSLRREGAWATVAIKTTPGWLSCLRIDPAAVGCNIKANISYKTGERIYHDPGQEYYWDTRLNLLKGERWFCSEEATQGGMAEVSSLSRPL